MNTIKDETYIRLVKDKSNGVRLTDPEITYVSKMEQLEYMCDFRPDWFPDEYKQKKIEGLYADFLKVSNGSR